MALQVTDRVQNRGHEAFIDRVRCPSCGQNDAAPLFSVDPEIFVGGNATIDESKLRSSGLLDLPHIEIVECRQCRLRYVGKTLKDEWTSLFWDQVYIPSVSFQKIEKPSKRRKNKELWAKLSRFLRRNQIGEGDTLNVLDFGCGWGDFLLDARSPGVRVVGVEISEPKVEFARKEGLEVYASLDEIPSDIVFHAFHCDQVLEHLVDPAPIMQQIAPRLHRDFLGFVSVPNYSDDRISELAQNIRAGIPVSDKDLITWDHVNFFSPETFAEFLKRQGMVEVSLPSGRPRSKSRSTAAFIRRADASPPVSHWPGQVLWSDMTQTVFDGLRDRFNPKRTSSK